MPRTIPNPLTLRLSTVSHVLRALAAQENCDGEPYDQMQAAAGYIDELEAALQAALGQIRALEWSVELPLGEDWRDLSQCPSCGSNIIPGCRPYEHAEGCKLAVSIAMLEGAVAEAEDE
jgi:hypothetical protein